jgi:hypothetical protein
MNLYTVCREEWDYDEYDSAVVAAVDAPSAVAQFSNLIAGHGFTYRSSDPTTFTCTLIGQALHDTEEGLVLSSFKGG